MAKRRTIRVGARPEVFTGAGIDPRSGAIAIYHVPGTVAPSDTPARDLNGGDLARIAYNRAFRAADGERPEPASPEDLAELAIELVATHAFSVDPPREADAPAAEPTEAVDPPTTTEPEPPAEAPEG